MNKKHNVITILTICFSFIFLPFMFTAESDLTPEDMLKSDLVNILQQEELDHALPAIHVRSAKSGETIFSYNSETSMVPASGQKLLIGAAALDTLGPNYTFKTGLYYDGNKSEEVLHGDLYLKGTGDPTRLSDDYEQFAKELAEDGIKVIKGDLVADDTFFDDMRLSLDMSWFNQPRHTAAQVSALTISPNDNYDTGSVILKVLPGENKGDDAAVTIFPETDYLTLFNDVTTSKETSTQAIEWGREHGNNRIFIKGNIPKSGDGWRELVTVWEPTNLVQHLFHDALKKHGIQLQGKLKLGETPENSKLIVEQESIPLEELFVPFMKLSNNGIAEILTKTMGQEVHGEGSWEAGLNVVEAYLTTAGLNTEAIQLRDGSGMSHLNKIPVEDMTKLLQYVQQETWYDTYRESLPLAGDEDRLTGGTLGSRMRGTVAEGNVQAKTGTITSKTSLSGYVTTQDEEELIFSIMINNYIGSHPKHIEDEIAVRLATFSKETNH
ncbi:D-alanyl-D-alanine carboxypeptidase/D-alanyl-D-alanine-endopeptidase [Salipaludibacillus sp. LMS25]|uniref:D-alanyl-D-alanine carboxypeptidase/D-alanyl-D-alanine endopeptidase n=1 Tax=Salipaludibacillus sp. LMS25 TaxID=2924031 RepID=UPI0020CFFF66|nr:D-alanyl-D-alanine carboxypeptidase/D-alanyl-D-alanine-endopeptidase [Salipaludibacillus sp. LMS25]UTR14981.1 D-alanyl-D-alanine carboxypeptidase/D-alanyl-D-alanine-endopeptidase [Salipaludibacillus sp. LMS25]